MSNATLKELSARLAAKACSSVELAQDFINKINVLNKDLGCYVTVDAERTVAQAQAADARLKSSAQASGDEARADSAPAAIKPRARMMATGFMGVLSYSWM